MLLKIILSVFCFITPLVGTDKGARRVVNSSFMTPKVLPAFEGLSFFAIWMVAFKALWTDV